MKGKAQRNVTILEANLEIYGNDPVTFVEIGDSYAIIGDPELADLWYRKTVELPNAETQFSDVASQAWMGLGNSANVRKQFTEAEHCFKKVIQLCPGRIDLFYNLAVTYEKQNDLENAVNTLTKIFTTPAEKVKVGVDVRQAKVRGAMKLIRLALRWGNEQVIQEKIAFVLQEMPDRLEIVNVCAAGYYFVGNYSESLTLFDRSWRERPEGNVDALVGLTMIYLTAEQDERALSQIQNGEQMFVDNCRYQLFRSLFAGNYSSMESFTKGAVKSEISYLSDLFNLTFDESAIIERALPDEE